MKHICSLNEAATKQECLKAHFTKTSKLHPTIGQIIHKNSRIITFCYIRDHHSNNFQQNATENWCFKTKNGASKPVDADTITTMYV